MKGQFSTAATEFLSVTSATRNKDAAAQIQYTPYQCILACLRKISLVYEKVVDVKGKGLISLKEIRDQKKEDIIDLFDKKDWGTLKLYLGSPLPEVNDDTYFRSDINVHQHELGWKDLRNLIVWQLWIEKLWEVWETFNKDVFDMLTSQNKYTIRNALFHTDETIINEMTIDDLEIFKYIDSQNKEWKEDIKEYYLNDFKKSENKVNWFMYKMQETTARMKREMLMDVDMVSKNTKLSTPKQLRNMMQFMTYTSMTEKELKNTLSTLDKLKDADEAWFLQSVGK